MHDPLVVAFEIPRPWPRGRLTPGGRRYWPTLITVWHREPRGHDSGEVCQHFERWQDEHGEWQIKALHKWKFHIHHWKVQVHPLQRLRRRLLTRCAWCGGRSVDGDLVNFSNGWGRDRGPWWRGERGLYHYDCSSVERAHATCLCDVPMPDHGSHGRCLVCDKFRPYGMTPTRVEINRILASVPTGQRDQDVMRAVEAIVMAEPKLQRQQEHTE